MNDIKTMILDFANRLQTLIETAVIDRARDAVFTAMGIPSRKKPGRPPNAVKLSAAKASAVATRRKKAPIQLCPVPGCKNAAAPIFGMVCAKHKDLPKATIRKYREARKAKKLKAEGRTLPKAKKKPSLPKRARSKASNASLSPEVRTPAMPARAA